MKTRRIFVSMPTDKWLTQSENALKWAMVERIESLGYSAEIFFDPRGKPSLSASQAWSASDCEEVMRRCEGCALLGFPRWRFPGNQYALPTDFSQYEGGLAYTLRLPLLVFAHAAVDRRVVFNSSYSGYVGKIPQNATKGWLKTKDFTVPFNYWKDALSKRRDIFLGYCSASSAVAKKIKSHLTKSLKLTVLDWATDFDPARTIIQQIEDGAERCGAGIFLFTKDDDLARTTARARSVPRDNVVFEAGYFAASKGKSRVLIVLETGAKMPADLGGDIYASLLTHADITAARPVLRKFAQAL